MEEKNALPLENTGISPGRSVPEALGKQVFPAAVLVQNICNNMPWNG